MEDTYTVRCACGRSFTVSAFAFGMTSRCACGAAVEVSAATARRVAAPMPTRPQAAPVGRMYYEPTPSAEDGTACARCSEPFKGPWDRVTLPGRVVCFRCGNQWEDGGPLWLQSEEHRRPKESIDPANLGPPANHDALVEAPSYFLGMEVGSHAFRMTLYGVALLMLVVTAGFFVADNAGLFDALGEFEYVGEAALSGDGDVPAWFSWAGWAMKVSTMWLAGAIAVYVTMHVWECLPKDELAFDLSYAAGWAAAITGVFVGVSALAPLLPAIAAFVPIAAVLLAYAMASTAFGFSLKEGGYACLVYGAAYLMLSSVRLVAVAGLAQLASA